MYVFLQERDSLCYESVASENSTSKSKYFIIQRAHSLLYTPLPALPTLSYLVSLPLLDVVIILASFLCYLQ